MEIPYKTGILINKNKTERHGALFFAVKEEEMIETVASADMLIDEVMRVKKNRLAPDFATGKEKRLSIVSGVHGDEVAGQYICYEVIRRIKRILIN